MRSDPTTQTLTTVVAVARRRGGCAAAVSTAFRFVSAVEFVPHCSALSILPLFTFPCKIALPSICV